MILDSSSLEVQAVSKKDDYFKKIKKTVNQTMKSFFIREKIITCLIIIKELTQVVDTVISAINVGKYGILLPQILTPNILGETIKGFENLHKTKYQLDNDEENYQHLIDNRKIGLAIIKGLFAHIFRILVL